MPLFATIASLFQSAGANAADGSADAPATIDNNMNLLASFIARLRDGDRATPFGTVASAGTIILDGTPANVTVTGTTAISAVTLAEGSTKIVRFAGALTLTNGAGLVLPGSTNIVTATGDYAVFTGRASGIVECTSYQPAGARPWVIQAGNVTTTASGVTLTFPKPFPNACIAVILTPVSTGTGVFATHTPQVNTGVYIQTWLNSSTQVVTFVDWIAIGY